MSRPSESRPLRVMLVCPHAAMREQFLETIAPLHELAAICHTLTEYPTPPVLARALRLFAPEIMVLSFEQCEVATAVILHIEGEVRGLPVIGIHPTGEASLLLQAMHAGTREFVNMPFEEAGVGQVLTGVRQMLQDAPPAYANTEHIYSILPSKQGVGATALAMNMSAAVARRRDSRVLLADLDLSCGMMRFLLKLPAGSIMDAFLRSAEMDLELWRQTVLRREGVEILHSGGLDPHARLDPRQVQYLIDFARKDYQFMCFDMSGNLEQYSLQVMAESKEIFIVCTPEPVSLELASEKLACLAKAGLRDRTSLLLNRCRSAEEVKRAEQIGGAPVRATFPECSQPLETATMAATWVAPGCALGRDLESFVFKLMGPPGPRLTPPPEVRPSLAPDIEEGAIRVMRS